MGKLNAERRNALAASEFGLPKTRQYPMEDAGHARNAKSRASEMEHEGRMTKSEEGQIDRKADKVLGHGGHKSGYGR